MPQDNTKCIENLVYERTLVEIEVTTHNRTDIVTAITKFIDHKRTLFLTKSKSTSDANYVLTP